MPLVSVPVRVMVMRISPDNKSVEAKTPAPTSFSTGSRFTGQHVLIDRSHPLSDFAVNRDDLPGTDYHNIPLL
ncbi:MAG UNVERIFIED_CONTAM: hypothetical protein LVT10_05475 [Anaerolineae bacterium]